VVVRPVARTNTRFGEQPIRGVVRRRHWNLKLIAFESGVGYNHLLNAVNGVTAPSPQLREKLSEFLGLPVEKLFSTDALAATYSEGRARGGKISRRYGRRAA
jgi:transcriptional regulator with XRE-family HTH domain